ncbi:hypothetical protein BV25DRAFT_1836679 [Artomyces pyxidatus]|uniref:Uncharacterized protein n=1 Tax=Artomyces pyxidatus TaxID=48021 RepID=A0ACB8T9A2_9AGAM|nr:hypothetical protein BV25DRAFT_1836679 [Artomyces pyxidatus]
MRSFISAAFLASAFLASAVSAAVPETVNGHTPNPDRCPSAKVVSATSHPAVGGGNLTIAHFACDHSSAPVTRNFGRFASARATTLEHESRDQSECTEAKECKCGESCVQTCTKTTSLAPTQSNCNNIAESIDILATPNGIGQTFFVDANNSVLLFFSDCEWEWDNISKNTIEYCWDDFVNTEAAIETSCLGSGSTGGVCKSVGNDFQLSFAFA